MYEGKCVTKDCLKFDMFTVMVWFLNRLQSFYFSAAPSGQGPLIVEAARSHSDTPHSEGLLWSSDQPDVETST
jgi:hypothetical protein